MACKCLETLSFVDCHSTWNFLEALELKGTLASLRNLTVYRDRSPQPLEYIPSLQSRMAKGTPVAHMKMIFDPKDLAPAKEAMSLEHYVQNFKCEFNDSEVVPRCPHEPDVVEFPEFWSVSFISALCPFAQLLN